MRDTTLLFLIKRGEDGEVTEICLAMKKRSFGVGRWNGTGGKVNEFNQGETVLEAVERETKEEIGVDVNEVNKVAELEFHFPAKPEWDQLTHVYFAEGWEGEPTESEEMKPAWFAVSDIPYDNMWPDDKFWLPLVLKGKKVKGQFEFGEGDAILKHKVEIVERLE